MNLGRIFAHAVVRRLAYVLVAALLAWVGMGKAHAQDFTACHQNSPGVDPGPVCETRQVAYERVLAVCELNTQSSCSIWQVNSQRYSATKTGDLSTGRTYRSWPVATPCPAGNVWDDNLHECVPTQCQNAPPITNKSSKSPYTCSNGCRYEQDSAVSVCLGDGADMFCPAAQWKATGGACHAGDAEPATYNPDKSVCHTTGGSYQECVKPNGEHCVQAPSGQQLCWTPTSLGERMTQDGTLGGNRQLAPSTPSPPAKQTDPTVVTTTTTTIGSATYNTTISTGTGAKAGQTDTGVPGDNDGDGKGDGKGGEGDGDDEGSASGGDSCNSAPVISGDPVLAMVARQAWLIRCANDGNGNGQPDWTEVEGDGTEGAGEDPDAPHRNVPLGIGLLDQNGFGLSRSCPTFGTVDLGQFGSINLDEEPWLCDFCNIVKVILSMLGAFIAFRILAGS